MIEKVKKFIREHKTKAMLSVGTAAASTVPMTLAAAAEDTNLDGVITNPRQTIDMWATITGGVTYLTKAECSRSKNQLTAVLAVGIVWAMKRMMLSLIVVL